MWLAVYLIAVCALTAWALVCNHWACDQRIALVRNIHKRVQELIATGSYEGWRDYYAELNRISHDRHMFMLMTFRDPMKLYSFS